MLGNNGRSITKAIFTPFARLLNRAHITPNVVTLTGTSLTVISAVLLLAQGYIWQGGIVLGIILFADSIDGILARMQGTESKFGAFLDSCMDRISDGAVFGSLLYWAIIGLPESSARDTAVIAGVISMIAVGAVPYTRAKAESIGVTAKIGIAERTDRLIIALVLAAFTGWGWSTWFYAAGLIWVALASLITVGQRIIFTYKELKR